MKIVIIGAMERELAPMIAGVQGRYVLHRGHKVRLYETEKLARGIRGIGQMPARNAADAALTHLSSETLSNGPGLMISAGLAGALSRKLEKQADIVQAAEIISEANGQRIRTASGRGGLLSAGAIASAAVKSTLAERYEADAIEMEAYAVADVAQIHRVPFIALKAISDDFDFPCRRWASS